MSSDQDCYQIEVGADWTMFFFVSRQNTEVGFGTTIMLFNENSNLQNTLVTQTKWDVILMAWITIELEEAFCIFFGYM